jgi:hypothetical protein
MGRTMRNQRSEYNLLTIENPIQFGQDGNYFSFMPEGFGQEDSVGHTWNDGFVATLRFQTLGPSENLALNISAKPFIIDSVPGQELFAYLNGLWIGFILARSETILSCRLGLKYIGPGENIIAFVMPNAISPREIGTGSDVRRLAFAFREITLVAGR